jgi:hypothetical protein
MNYKELPIGSIKKDRKFLARDLYESEIEKIEQKQKEFLDELLEEEAETLALFINKMKNHKNKEK